MADGSETDTSAHPYRGAPPATPRTYRVRWAVTYEMEAEVEASSAEAARDRVERLMPYLPSFDVRGGWHENEVCLASGCHYAFLDVVVGSESLPEHERWLLPPGGLTVRALQKGSVRPAVALHPLLPTAVHARAPREPR